MPAVNRSCIGVIVNKPYIKGFNSSRLKRLKKETQDFRSALEDRLSDHFKDRSVEEVIKIMAEWISLDDLLELNGKISILEGIKSIPNRNNREDKNAN